MSRSLVLGGFAAVALLCGGCGAKSAGSTTDAAVPVKGTFAAAFAAFRAYAASKLGVSESKLKAGPGTEAIAATMDEERVGSLWAFLAHTGDPQHDVRGWATADGTVITLDQNLGVLLAEAGVWGGGVTPPLTATEIAERLTWSLGMNTTLFFNLSLGIPVPELVVTDGVGTLIFVVDAQPSGRAGAGRPPTNLVRYEIKLTADQRATATHSPLKNPGITASTMARPFDEAARRFTADVAASHGKRPADLELQPASDKVVGFDDYKTGDLIPFEATAAGLRVRGWGRGDVAVFEKQGDYAPLFRAAAILDPATSMSARDIAARLVWMMGPELKLVDPVNVYPTRPLPAAVQPPVIERTGDGAVLRFFYVRLDTPGGVVVPFAAEVKVSGSYQAPLTTKPGP